MSTNIPTPSSTNTDGELMRAYTLPEVADLLRIDLRTVRRMIERGELTPFYPRGKKGMKGNQPERGVYGRGFR